MNKIKERLGKPTPVVIKKLQKILAAIAGSATVVSTILMLFPETKVPDSVPFILAGAGFINHTLLELFVEEDNS
jgi:hypothetical protein